MRGQTRCASRPIVGSPPKRASRASLIRPVVDRVRPVRGGRLVTVRVELGALRARPIEQELLLLEEIVHRRLAGAW